MISREFTIGSRSGLDAGRCVRLTRMACRFDSAVYMCRAGQRVNAKSVVHVIMFAAPAGSTIRLEAEGHDAEVAVASLGELIEARFSELS